MEAHQKLKLLPWEARLAQEARHPALQMEAAEFPLILMLNVALHDQRRAFQSAPRRVLIWSRNVVWFEFCARLENEVLLFLLVALERALASTVPTILFGRGCVGCQLV